MAAASGSRGGQSSAFTSIIHQSLLGILRDRPESRLPYRHHHHPPLPRLHVYTSSIHVRQLHSGLVIRASLLLSLFFDLFSPSVLFSIRSLRYSFGDDTFPIFSPTCDTASRRPWWPGFWPRQRRRKSSEESTWEDGWFASHGMWDTIHCDAHLHARVLTHHS